MTDVIKRAQELVEKFHGKITEGTWKWHELFYGGHDIYIYNLKEPNFPESASDYDIELVENTPETLSVIKGLLAEIDAPKMESNDD